MAISKIQSDSIDSSSLELGPLSVDDANNRIGIGTTNPDHVIHVSSATTGNLLRLSSDVSGSNSNLTVDGATANTIKLHAGYFDSLELGANDTTQITILSGGNVGIGTSSPDLDFEVANTFGVIYITVADDAVATIPAPKNMGFLSIVNNPLSNTPNQSGLAMIAYDCGTSKQIQYVTESYPGGQGTLNTLYSNLYNTTNLTGTTGPDAAYSVSCAVDYNIQVENRTGATTTFALTFF